MATVPELTIDYWRPEGWVVKIHAGLSVRFVECAERTIPEAPPDVCGEGR